MRISSTNPPTRTPDAATQEPPSGPTFLELDPFSSALNHAKAFAVAFANGDMVLPRECFERCLIGPDYYRAHSRMGQWHWSYGGDLRRSVSYRREMELAPRTCWVREMLAAVYVVFGDMASAESVFQDEPGRACEYQMSQS